MSNSIMIKLINRLNEASYAYYNTENPIMSDAEFDALMDALKDMERDSGIIMSNSPTQKVGAPVLSELKKVKIQNKPMLSLNKVHSAEEVFSFAKGKKILGLVKCDGLSTRLVYENGKLVSAHTRGDGYIGSDVTDHVKNFINVPLTINTTKRYVVDGESIIKDKDFATLTGLKNNRNAASGALSLLDTKEVRNRKLSFILWDVIEGEEEEDSLTERIYHALKLGFDVISGVEISSKDLSIEKIDEGNKIVMNKAKELGIPCDGVVWKYDSVSYGEAQGSTSHHFNNGIAWKPEIETAKTILKDIEWTIGRTGVLTPVAIFEPVDLDGSTVERASLHNISIMNELLGSAHATQPIYIYKANMIIPQILTAEEKEPGDFLYTLEFIIPEACPICGGDTEIRKDNDSEVLYCANPACSGKLINRLDHFCGKKGLDIKHLSKATLEKLVNWGWINTYQDIFILNEHREAWIKKPGFGEASVDRLLNSIRDAKTTTLDKIIAAAGIPEIGSSVAKELAKHYKTWEDFRAEDNFLQYDGIGEVMNNHLLNFNYEDLNLDYTVNLHLKLEEEKQMQTEASGKLEGCIFVITGKVSLLAKNRDGVKDIIEAAGGKVASAVSTKTNYLLNNDNTSTSAKNEKAKALGIKIITEQELKNMLEN